MRTSYIASILLVFMLLGATTSLADSSAYAYADSSTTYDTDSDGDNYSITAPATGTYNWDYNLDVLARATINDGGLNLDHAYASASASVDRFGSYTESVDASAHRYFFNGPGTTADGDCAWDSGTSTLRVGASLEFTESCEALASWNSPIMDSSVEAESYAVTAGGMLRIE